MILTPQTYIAIKKFEIKCVFSIFLLVYCFLATNSSISTKLLISTYQLSYLLLLIKLSLLHSLHFGLYGRLTFFRSRLTSVIANCLTISIIFGRCDDPSHLELFEIKFYHLFCSFNPKIQHRKNIY